MSKKTKRELEVARGEAAREARLRKKELIAALQQAIMSAEDIHFKIERGTARSECLYFIDLEPTSGFTITLEFNGGARHLSFP